MKQLTGDKLSPAVQRDALAQFVHRYTGDHKPAWAREYRSDGTVYPLQFASDAEWLANTTFTVRDDGQLALNHRYCASRPTWPQNPELRISKRTKD